MNFNIEALKMHEDNRGKIAIKSKIELKTKDDLSTAYTPGVAEPCRKIHENPDDVYKYTSKGNLVAVVSDGSAVLGLGNIGPKAAIPVMEGKCILFKEFGDVDAFPICLDTQDTEEIIKAVKQLAPVFGGINLEDISAPRCFEIEKRLIEELDIPVFHDDQHGTAVVVLAALINSLKLRKSDITDIECVINGAGAAGIAICKLLQSAGIKNVILCDTKGAISKNRTDLNSAKAAMAEITNVNGESGTLADVIKGKDLFIGVSAADMLSKDMVKSMNNPIIFAMANPTPEILPQDALDAGAFIVGTGRSDFDNQINNVLVFPGLFRAVLDLRLKAFTEEIKIAAAKAIASVVKDEELSKTYILPSSLDRSVVPAIVEAIKAL
ncbi:NAD(P)-dependent malic enzyme [Proteocatella sphenisci]|uniref:NAD(P)-dependent malic enzyme n=1 Tax=Proteocatella sphenisci TaxID=181070 RepID=UPI00048E0E15|nr:NADP-dependent malic enzyme [Proteocatella sphenisci]